MGSLDYQNNELHFGENNIAKIASDYPTPFYLYFAQDIINQYQRFRQQALEYKIFDQQICFALKANPNPHLLQALFKEGAGADIVSGGELKRALENGCNPNKIVFSGVGKTEAEIKYALKQNIYSFNVESFEELREINQLAEEMGKTARFAFRVNPIVNVKTHRYISTGYKTHKFGILKKDILKFIKNELPELKHVQLKGLSVHIGSQLTDFKATKKAIAEVCEIAHELDFPLEFIDVGGGLGVNYYKEQNFNALDVYMKTVAKTLKKGLKGLKPKPTIVFEPGRFISASSGLFITKVVRTKKSDGCRFVIVDGGMNDFVRTSLYEAFHKIVPLSKDEDKKEVTTEIVGPICETSCSFASNYKIQELQKNDLIAVLDVGAYGHSMSSTYNLRNRPKEVVIGADQKVEVFEH
ncbi:MAG: diaminopimelate decarboxylase [Halobacteriovoraceae bacterium]|nr:diaminopimelate decarboxylase [Halobacteriovoraceae bacterium]|tara:strand:+ start:1452 stop:2684 length:1233 start_codon:yes stop_codon:yes gene_type:complete